MRNIRVYICIVLLFIIQISFANLLDINGCIPNFLLVFCICFAVVNGLTLNGMIQSAVCGLLSDIAGALPWGTSVILFMVFYSICTLVGGKFYRAKLPISMIFGAVITFLYESVSYLVMFMEGTHVSFGLSIMRVILPVCLYHVILAFVMYFVVQRFIGERPLSETEME